MCAPIQRPAFLSSLAGFRCPNPLFLGIPPLQLWWVELLAAGAIVPKGTGHKARFEVPGILVESQDPWVTRAAQALLPGTYNRVEISLRWGGPLREFHREALSRGLLVAPSFFTPGRLTQGGLQWREEQLAKASVAQRTPQAHTLGWAVAAGGLAVLAATPFEALAEHVHARGPPKAVLLVGVVLRPTPAAADRPLQRWPPPLMVSIPVGGSEAGTNPAAMAMVGVDVAVEAVAVAADA